MSYIISLCQSKVFLYENSSVSIQYIFIYYIILKFRKAYKNLISANSIKILQKKYRTILAKKKPQFFFNNQGLIFYEVLFPLP